MTSALVVRVVTAPAVTGVSGTGVSGWSALLGLLAALFGLLVIVAAAVAYFRASFARATIETLRDSNVALTARVSELEADNLRIKAENEAQKQELGALRTYVSGTEAVHALEGKVDGYQQELRTHRQELLDRLDRLAGKGQA